MTGQTRPGCRYSTHGGDARGHAAPPRSRSRHRAQRQRKLAIGAGRRGRWCSSSSSCGRSSTAARAATRSSGPRRDGEPVTWDHCLAIRYQVNPDGAPENWRELVDGAFDEVTANSGFVFLDAGETGNRTLAGTYNPGATRGEPVLIIWSSQGRLHSLQGDTVGLGGGAVVEVNGLPRFVTGVDRARRRVAQPHLRPAGHAQPAAGPRARDRARARPRPRRRLPAAHERGVRRPGRSRCRRPRGPRGSARRPLRLTRMSTSWTRQARIDAWTSPGGRARRANAGSARCCAGSRSSTTSTGATGSGSRGRASRRASPAHPRHRGMPASSGTGAVR